MKITIEIVAHYPKIYTEKLPDGTWKIISEDPNEGTFHAYWIEEGMDLRCCRYKFMDARYCQIHLPSEPKFDKDEKKWVIVPFINYMDKVKADALYNAIRAGFFEYAKEKYLAYNPARFIRPKKPDYKAARKPQHPSEIKPTGTLKRYTDYQNYKSKIYKNDN